jgi:hypothetical protein
MFIINGMCNWFLSIFENYSGSRDISYYYDLLMKHTSDAQR